MKKILKLPLILFFSSILLSCTSVGSFDGVMTMLVEQDNLKYYIRPEKMISKIKRDPSYLMIDFSYQMKNNEYVSNSYTNFTIYNSSIDFIKVAFFVDKNENKISLSDIATLDRNAKIGYIRVTTILEKDRIKDVLTGLSNKTIELRVLMENGKILTFVASDELVKKINMAFDR